VNRKTLEELLEQLRRLRANNLSAAEVYRRVEKMIESDSSASRFVLSVTVTIATALTGAVSVAGMFALTFERELTVSLIAILAGFITAVARLLANTPGRSASTMLKALERQTKDVYRRAIGAAGLAQEGSRDMTLGITNPTITEAARKQLRNLPVSPFAPDGLSAFHDSVDRYIHDLLMECVGVMRRHDAPAISGFYVTMAVKNIARQRRRKLHALCGMLGGAFLSGAFSSLYEIVKGHRPPEIPSVAAACALFVVGVILIAYQIVRE